MGEQIQEVLYETRYHQDDTAKGGSLSLLSVQGLKRLKEKWDEKWDERKNPRRPKKWMPLFVSSGVEYVAVPSGNKITILQKGDDYKVPCGILIGMYCISLWRITGSLDPGLVFCSSQFEGLFSTMKGYIDPLTNPKVVISPQSNYIAVLDITGKMDVFNLVEEQYALSVITFDGSRDRWNNIADFTWWSDRILILAKLTGVVTMLDILSGAKLMDSDPIFSMPVLERVGQCQGCVFVLESLSCKERDSHASHVERETLEMEDKRKGKGTQDRFSQLDIGKLSWNLISFSERSVSAMYSRVDKDEILKSQWLLSDRGTNEINRFLSNIKDKEFVLSECLEKVSVQEYIKFRTTPLSEVAATLAESGKIGALNLLFKRHPYSLAPFVLEILAAIPETIPVQTYGQLLPGRSPPATINLRDEDWVECEKMVNFISELSTNLGNRYFWPSVDELSSWYKTRARDIDISSGQLDNSVCLVEFACRKGIVELQPYHEEISYLYQLIYSDETDAEDSFTMSLVSWEELSDYEKLSDKAIPFMRSRSLPLEARQTESFLVRWLKEIAADNKLDICATVIENGCGDFEIDSIFIDEVEAVECALQWNTMASILSKLPKLKDTGINVGGLEKRVQAAEGHVDAGRLLAYYQFFLESQSDAKGVKQILRLILSKFGRRQPGRSDNDWANIWRDMQCFQEKAFPFLDLEYMLIEFCRGLLKAGKFSLARNYLKGTSTVCLTTEKAENLVIQAVREYFFSASSLSCAEVITTQIGAYLNVDELIEIANLLGLHSQEDIAAVQEAVAREAAVVADLQLAFDLCLVLAKKGHGSVWDLCAAIARGPFLDNMDNSSRKQLLGFSLCHCDEESISELLHAWKDLDMQSQCETRAKLSGTTPPNVSIQGSLLRSGNYDDQEIHLRDIKNVLSTIAKDLFVENGNKWDSLLENGKVLSFAALQLPWMIELSRKEDYGKKAAPEPKNDIAPTDDFMASLAESIMQSPVTEDEDLLGCSILLNLVDAFLGVETIEGQLKSREAYQEICSIMNMGMAYSSLNNSGANRANPAKRRELLLGTFQEKHSPLSPDTMDGKVQSTFWREWKSKLEEQKLFTDQSKNLEKMPGVDTARFLSGDSKHIENVVFSLIDGVKMEKKPTLKEVLFGYLCSALVSEFWSNSEIISEISDQKREILSCAAALIDTISSNVYPAINGCNKQRLSYIFSILSECYSHLKDTEERLIGLQSESDPTNILHMQLAEFYKTLDQECRRISFIKSLNFKNIAVLGGLNVSYFNEEVYSNIDESTVEALAEMVGNLVGIFPDSELKEQILISQAQKFPCIS
ncbi:hypothetical protein MKX01_038737 [Papaver californicum]|nr:hypothetical protein MKX01_038737 [Papaver californicum]